MTATTTFDYGPEISMLIEQDFDCLVSINGHSKRSNIVTKALMAGNTSFCKSFREKNLFLKDINALFIATDAELIAGLPTCDKLAKCQIVNVSVP